MTIEYRCPNCSASLPTAFSNSCNNCGKSFTSTNSSPDNATELFNTDKPAWEFWHSLLLWFLSVLLILFAQVPALAAWTLWLKLSGQTVPAKLNIEEQPTLAVFFVLSTFASQLITIAVSYRFISKTSNGKFLSALGWYWPENFNPLKTITLAFLVFISFIFIASVLPNKENSMQKLIESSMAARISVGIVAVIGAPFTEELIYRGILYSGLCKNFGRGIAILGVSILFLLVHVPQYWGAWGGILGLGFLSLVLTLVRSYSGALLPSFMIHLIFNSIQVSLLMLQGLLKLPKNL